MKCLGVNKTFGCGALFFFDSEKLSVPAGIWIKPSRTSRMREKRADFVAGCLGGRVIAAGGLGEHIHFSPSFSGVRFC